MDLEEIVLHPFTALMLGLSALAQLGFGAFEPVWSLVSATSGMWFPAIAVTSGTILPEIGFEGVGTMILLGAASVFVAVQVDRLLDRVEEWRSNR